MGAFLMGLPLLQGVTAFLATTSIATVGLALAYGLPIGLHMAHRNSFEHGPFTLGRYSTHLMCAPEPASACGVVHTNL